MAQTETTASAPPRPAIRRVPLGRRGLRPARLSLSRPLGTLAAALIVIAAGIAVAQDPPFNPTPLPGDGSGRDNGRPVNPGTGANRPGNAPAGGPPAPSTPSPEKPVPEKKGIPREPIEVLYALGPFLYPLGICSIIVVWFSVERLVLLRRARVIPRPFVKRFFEHLEQGKVDAKGAMKLCEDNGSPIAMVFASGLKKWGKPSVEVEQAIIDGGERQLSQLRKHLRVLNGASTVAPLLGLLGTVVGMIDSFNTIAMKQAMGRSEELAAGIGLALLTTAVGLLIAIPALIMYMYLSGRVDALVIEMDGYGQELVDQISGEALAEQARSGRTAASAPSRPGDAKKS